MQDTYTFTATLAAFFVACGGTSDSTPAPADGGVDGTSTPIADAARDSPAAVAPPDGSAPSRRLHGGAFVHLFEWTWLDIAKECTLFLGPRGFAGVQVSPPSEHAILGNYPWWQRYQTVGYELDQSRSGTKDEFVQMVQACTAAGVDVYVDAVINHMTGQTTGTGSNGTTFRKYEYPGLYTSTDFHQPACQVQDSDYANNADHVRHCELLGLADLDTGADAVRAKIAAYLIALRQIGVRGFRVDAAKYISPEDLNAILTRVAQATSSLPPAYYFFEVTYNPGEIIQPSDYFDVGRAGGADVGITEFAYGTVGDRFLNRGGQTISTLKSLGDSSWGFIPSERAVAFTGNHDTVRASAIDYKDAPYDALATLFMLAWPYGYPSILSGYAFDHLTDVGRSKGPPSDGAGHTSRIYTDGDTPACAPSPASASVGMWTCEHRAPATANMVTFRRVTADATTVDGWWDNGANQIAFGRGDRGFVVINRDATALHRTFSTKLAAGRYCDVIGGELAGGACTGAVITVDGAGSADFTVAANSASAIHVESVVR